jgi:hypothetical protein
VDNNENGLLYRRKLRLSRRPKRAAHHRLRR